MRRQPEKEKTEFVPKQEVKRNPENCERPITVVVGRLDKAVASLRDSLNSFYRDLEYVSTRNDDGEKIEACDSPSTGCPVVDDISSIIYEIERMEQVLIEHKQRLG